MLKLFVSSLLMEVESLKEILEQEGIVCTVKNQQGSSLAGEVPFAEVFPELWVVNNDDYPQAQEILESWRQGQPAGVTDWTCPSCGESHEKDFTSCWKCGKERKVE